jgi:predicted nucleotidyltransferase
MFVENIIGSKAKVKILRVLVESRTAYRLKEIMDATELSIGIIHQALKDLVEEGIIIKIKGTRKERLFKFNTDSPFAASIFDIFRIEKTKYRKEAVLQHTWTVLERVISKLEGKAHLIALFGSHARGHAAFKSDIDLLIIHDDNQSEIFDILSKVKSKSKIQPVAISRGAFKDDIKNDTLFYKNIKSDSIILCLDPGIKKEIAIFLEEIKYEKREAV